MAKKLITFLLAITLIAGSSVSIYATDETTIDDKEITIIAANNQDVDAASMENGASPGGDAVINPGADTDDDAAPVEKETKAAKTKKAKSSAASKKEAKYKRGLAAYIRHVNPSVGKTKSLNMAGYFISKGKKYNLPPEILMAVAQNESTFYTNVCNPYGYKGLMQTSDSLARQYGYKPSSLYKAQVSIEVGARYLSSMKKQFKSYSKALSAYAYGPGAVKAGRYSTGIANRVLKYRDNIEKYLKRNNYV
ncbi:transglycosylase SLT domain-containing protein [Ihubacter sp. rT4E-8]|uniref:transglycosylase SLT domain-containing protein n=1 Tax=Ihubacter sp. rT4E-8 TaxID=3242369 RepID=UPI003CF5F279